MPARGFVCVVSARFIEGTLPEIRSDHTPVTGLVED
jgi:hypothetical protein